MAMAYTNVEFRHGQDDTTEHTLQMNFKEFAILDEYRKNITTVNLATDMQNVPSFKNCTNLKSVVIPEGMTYIPSYAFSGCTALTSISLPSTINEIGIYAFQNCTNLPKLTIGSSVQVAATAFDGVPSMNESSDPSSGTDPEPGTGSGEHIVLDSYNPTTGNAPWVTLTSNTYSINVADDVNEIPATWLADSFSGQPPTNVLDVTIPTTGTLTVNEDSFGYATNLSSLVINATALSFGGEFGPFFAGWTTVDYEHKPGYQKQGFTIKDSDGQTTLLTGYVLTIPDGEYIQNYLVNEYGDYINLAGDLVEESQRVGTSQLYDYSAGQRLTMSSVGAYASYAKNLIVYFNGLTIDQLRDYNDTLYLYCIPQVKCSDGKYYRFVSIDDGDDYEVQGPSDTPFTIVGDVDPYGAFIN